MCSSLRYAPHPANPLSLPALPSCTTHPSVSATCCSLSRTYLGSRGGNLGQGKGTRGKGVLRSTNQAGRAGPGCTVCTAGPSNWQALHARSTGREVEMRHQAGMGARSHFRQNNPGALARDCRPQGAPELGTPRLQRGDDLGHVVADEAEAAVAGVLLDDCSRTARTDATTRVKSFEWPAPIVAARLSWLMVLACTLDRVCSAAASSRLARPLTSFG